MWVYGVIRAQSAQNQIFRTCHRFYRDENEEAVDEDPVTACGCSVL
jgi:hypothetical protein